MLVGESQGQETAITVTGLKPSHFYNVRVIAVGSNSFQSGSRVVRLQTLDVDGRPHVDPSLLQDVFVAERQRPTPPPTSHSDENGSPTGPPPTVEAANVADTGLTFSREFPPSRRNTGGRRR